MDLSFIKRLILLLGIPFQSFLTIEILIIFILLYIFFIYNIKRNNKKVKYSLLAVIIFFFSFLVFYFSNDFSSVLTEILKVLFNCLYFPNVIFYIITVMISLISLIIYTFNDKNKIDKIITYTFNFLHLLLFTYFISLAITKNISLVDLTAIYGNNYMFVVILTSQIVFIIYFLYRVIYHYYLKIKTKTSKNKD